MLFEPILCTDLVSESTQLLSHHCELFVAQIDRHLKKSFVFSAGEVLQASKRSKTMQLHQTRSEGKYEVITENNPRRRMFVILVVS